MFQSNKIKQILAKNYILFIGICVIILVSTRYLDRLNYPAVLNDEFGYWANAASLAGYDWKGLISETPYYSYGYSLFLLPIICFFSPIYWYKVGIILNIVMLCFSYLICYKVSRKIYVDCEIKVLQLISLIVILFPSNIVYAQETWTETILYLLMWIVAYGLMKLEEKFSWLFFILLNFILAFMYMVHARSIAIVGITVLFEIIILKLHKKKYILFLLAIIIIGTVYVVNDQIKNIIIDNYYLNSSTSDINNVGLDSGTITKYINRALEYGKQIVLSFGYKLIFMIVASGMTLGFGIYNICKDIFVCIKEKGYFKATIVKGWILLSFLGELFICAIQMYNFESRKDIVVYSRYFENALGPLLLMSLVCIYLNSRENRWIHIIQDIIVLVFIPRIITIIIKAEGFFNGICSPVMGGFYDFVENREELSTVILSIVFLISGIILFVGLFVQNRKMLLLLLCPIFIFFIIMGEKGSDYVLRHREKVDKTVLGIESIIEEEYEEKDIFYVRYSKKDQYSIWPKYLQFLVPRNRIRVVEDIPNETKSLILLNNGDSESKNKIQDKYVLLYKGTELSLYKAEK